MKRNILIVIMIVLAVFLLAIGCSSETPSKNIRNSDAIVVYNALNRSGSTQTAEYLDYLKSAFGINLEPIELEENTSISVLGGILMMSPYEYMRLSEKELLLPLNDLIESNYYTRDIPKGLLNAVIDENGNIRGLLMSHDIYSMSRVYNQEFMDEFNYDVPRTAEEFKELLFDAKDVFNGDIIRVTPDNFLKIFYDVFAYYNCGLIDGRYTIGWNDTLNKYMDHIYTNEMVQSLMFIRQIKNEGLITVGNWSLKQMSNDFLNGELLTLPVYGVTGVGEKYYSNCFEASKFYFECVSRGMSLITIPASTNDPQKKFNDFIETFYGNEKINKAGRWGIEGENYTYINSDIISMDGFKNYYKSGICDWWLESHFSIMRDEKNMTDFQYWINNHWPEIKENFYNGFYNIIPLDKTIPNSTRTEFQMEIYNLFSNLLYRFIVEDMTPEAFIDLYTEESQKLGIDNEIKALNK